MYQIQKGDTLSGLAAQYGTTVNDLMAANKQIKKKELIYEGKYLNIPSLEKSIDKQVESLSKPSSNFYKDVVAQVESGHASYDAYNPRSGAYGKYQFIPDTADYYSKLLGFKGDEWKLPENQERMYEALTLDNQKALERKGLDTGLVNTYLAHQQGVKGLADILSGNLSEARVRNMRSNVPTSLKNLQGNELRTAYLDYWKTRLNNVRNNMVRV